jgi:hypothetical protein
LAIAAPFLVAMRVGDGGTRARMRAFMLLCFVAILLGCYLFYEPFDAWWYLRFLLPGYPALFVLMSVGLIALTAQFVGRAHGAMSLVLVGLLAASGVNFARQHAVLTFREGERKYAAVGTYIAMRLPQRAVLLSLLHSGSARYYSGRLTVFYPRIGSEQLDSVVDVLGQLGYHPYFLLEKAEEPAFRERFQAHSRLGALDWPPMAQLEHASAVRIYDPANRQEAMAGRPVPTEVIR